MSLERRRRARAPRGPGDEARRAGAPPALIFAVVFGVLALGGGAAFYASSQGVSAAALVKGRHITQTGRAGRVLLISFPARDAATVAAVEQGAVCEVLESVFVEGTKVYRVRMLGKSLAREDLIPLTLRLRFNVATHEDLDELDALPDTTVTGWTAFVSDD